MTSFRFVHSADIHLDSPLNGLSRYEGMPLDEVRRATREAFDNLISYVIDNKAAFLLIAGDLFDGEWRDMGTGLHFNAGISRLARAGIPTYIGCGNHDAQSVVRRALPANDLVHFFSSRSPETVRIPELSVAIHGWSFGERHVTEDVTPRYPNCDRSAFNIGVLHTSLGGYAEHIPYAPCSVSSLIAKGYNYWALGHIHEFAVLSEHPFVVYSGNLQGRHVRETGPKGAALVEVSDGLVESVTHVPLDVVRWHRVDVDCSGVQEELELHQLIKARLVEACVVNGGGRPAITRIILSGITDLAGKLADRGPAFRDDARALAAQVSQDIWLEKLLIQTRPPAVLPEPAQDEMNVSVILARAAEDQELVGMLRTDFRQFMSGLRPALDGSDEGLLSFARADKWADVADSAAAALRARLTGAN